MISETPCLYPSSDIFPLFLPLILSLLNLHFYDQFLACLVYLLIPAGFHVSAERLRDLAQLSAVADVLTQIPTPLQRVVAGLTSTLAVDRALERETWRVATLTLRRTAFNLARALAYLILRERDINLVYAVLQGKRLRLDSALIREVIGESVTSAAA